MKTTLAALAALLALCLLPAPAAAQVEVHAGIRFALPVMPPLVVIQPGVQVVQDYDDEVFVHGGYYWARRGDRWYRARGPQAEFIFVESRHVPDPLRRLPPGHYRRYRPPPPPRKLDKKEEKRLRKEEHERREERREDRKEDRREDRKEHGDQDHR